MPRHADPDARRDQLAAAALDVALAQGLDRVSVPRIAEQAGVSVGLVQHYFPAKATLVVTAYETLAHRVDARVGAIVEAGEAQRGSIREMVLAGLGELLPLDPVRRAEGAVRSEFAARALREVPLAAVASSLRAGLLERVTGAIENGRECGESAPGLDGSAARAAGLELLALTEGLAGGLLIRADAEPAGADIPERDAQDVLRQACARVFPGRCQHWQTGVDPASSGTGAPNRLDQHAGR